MAAGSEELHEMAAAVARAMGMRTGTRLRRLAAVDVAQSAGGHTLNAIQRDVIYSRIRDSAICIG